MTKGTFNFLGIVVSAACLVFAFWRIDFDKVESAFRHANYLTLPLMLAGLFAFYWLKAIRWRLLLSPLKSFRTRDVVGPLMIGFMGNNLLPAHLGEFVRIYVLGRKSGLWKTAVFSSGGRERAFDVVAILLLLGVSLLTVEGLPPNLARASLGIAAITLLV